VVEEAFGVSLENGPFERRATRGIFTSRRHPDQDAPPGFYRVRARPSIPLFVIVLALGIDIISIRARLQL
jgi:hypothetical protein